MGDNVTDIRAHRLADLIMAEWLDSRSDSGAVWLESHKALMVARGESPQAIIDEALEIATARWKKMFHVES
jgi:hypothetical protein